MSKEERPGLVVSAEPLNERYDVGMVVPITSRKGERTPRLGEILLPDGTGGLRVDSFALCYQVRTLDKTHLRRVYGAVSDGELQSNIQDMISLCLDL